jgi:ribosome maturation factor RimP
MATSDNNIDDLITKLVAELGYQVVELHISPAKSGKKVMLYIYKQGGIGLQDCSDVASALNLQLDVLLPETDIALQISTPGIDRQFKSNAEYPIFIGNRIEGLTKEGSPFVGLLSAATAEGFYLDNSDRLIAYPQVQKVKLAPVFPS